MFAPSFRATLLTSKERATPHPAGSAVHLPQHQLGKDLAFVRVLADGRQRLCGVLARGARFRLYGTKVERIAVSGKKIVPRPAPDGIWRSILPWRLAKRLIGGCAAGLVAPSFVNGATLDDANLIL
jgi:hypothetical protein